MSKRPRYTIGLHCGTRAVRGLLVDIADGRETATAIWHYRHGIGGVLSPEGPRSARHHPDDYLRGARAVIRSVLLRAERRLKRNVADCVVGIGVASTGSTPLPVDGNGRPLAFDARFADAPAALAWLWKDETSVDEASQVTALAQRLRPEYLATCGGYYSSDDFFSKILHCLHVDRPVFEAAHSWIEVADWLPAVLVGEESLARLAVGLGTAGHKAMFDPQWGGYPDRAFLARLAPEIAVLRDRLPKRALPVGRAVGGLSQTWASSTGLRPGTPVSVGGLDTHLCALGAGVGPGVVVQVQDCTRRLLLTVASQRRELDDLGGSWGVVRGSILPRYHGLATGLDVGNISGWYANCVGRKEGRRSSMSSLLRACRYMNPGAAGLLVLCDLEHLEGPAGARAETSLLIGQSQSTRPEEILRALLEAEAFRLVRPIRALEATGMRTSQIANCGEATEDGLLISQVCADIVGSPVVLFPFSRTAARGAAIAASVAAGRAFGGHGSLRAAQTAMSARGARTLKPRPTAKALYDRLSELHTRLSSAYGTSRWRSQCKRAVAHLDAMRRGIETSRRDRDYRSGSEDESCLPVEERRHRAKRCHVAAPRRRSLS